MAPRKEDARWHAIRERSLGSARGTVRRIRICPQQSAQSVTFLNLARPVRQILFARSDRIAPPAALTSRFLGERLPPSLLADHLSPFRGHLGMVNWRIKTIGDTMDFKDLFEVLVREHSDMLLVYLRASLRDRAAVDDIFQETWLVAWRRIHQFDPFRPFGPWLRGIASNLLKRHFRKMSGNRREVIQQEQVLEFLEARCESLHRQTGDTLDEKLESLRDCLKDLPEPYRSTIELRYREGMKGRELAERLSVSIENVKKRLQRGREKLLGCLHGKLRWAEATAT
ncbi:ECF RNA polymerase sigma factor SigW [Planctomycetes bacterium Pan216]|uniref:ECF RNA polymerase sigma factor SigW n=2 Tax=Kolteria novifilia TaxID=2527975 RepID=A0A518BB41_9BACT|nr:ECF RNA polymerase sigma factor SigW [Planctomycetes bacterium Pan216]